MTSTLRRRKPGLPSSRLGSCKLSSTQKAPQDPRRTCLRAAHPRRKVEQGSVEACASSESRARKILPGHPLARRRHTLGTGDPQEYHKCDLVLLFWSRPTKDSELVTREAQYALDRRGDGDIPDVVPVILETPPAPPPSPAAIHFNDRIHYLIAASSSRRSQAVEAGREIKRLT